MSVSVVGVEAVRTAAVPRARGHMGSEVSSEFESEARGVRSRVRRTIGYVETRHGVVGFQTYITEEKRGTVWVKSYAFVWFTFVCGTRCVEVTCDGRVTTQRGLARKAREVIEAWHRGDL